MKAPVLATLAALALTLSCTSGTDCRIERTLRKMTLEEKVGQMMQITVGVITTADGTALTAMADTVLGIYKVGSILNVPGGEAATPEAYRSLIRAIQDKSLEATGIPCIFGLDQIHGASYTVGGTLFPQEIALAATFNDDYAFRMGEITAYETRACNVPWVFSPVMDLGRNPLWPRMWESYGEDVLVNSRMARAEVLGQQGPDPDRIDAFHVGSSLKHYMAYGVPVSGQDRTPSMVTPRELKEKYFQPFKACVEAGAISIMVNSSINDGIPFHANRELLTEWVKEDLGWDGFFVTDWSDIRNLYERDHIAESNKDALCLAINAGIDMIMEPNRVQVCDELVALVREGRVKMSRVNDAVRRILRAKYRLGLFDDPYGEKASYHDFGCDAFVSVAREAAVESAVLLKNDNSLLPLKTTDRILLTGPNAGSMRTLNGGWSYTWQGDKTDEERFTGPYNTIYEALETKFDKVEYLPVLEYYGGRKWEKEIMGDISRAVRAAGESDVVVVCVGENSYCETPGNISDLNLSDRQKELVWALSAAGKPILLILNEGRPRLINDIEPLCTAIVDIMLPGNYGGDAIAALLCGEENFSGKLPFTYPRYSGKLATYDYKLCENRGTMTGEYNYDAVMNVQWPFGYGLSYTGFEYSDMRADRSEFRKGDVITVSVDVTNVGSVAGKESVLLYSSDLCASVTPEVRRLRDYSKIELRPGETRTVTFSLKAEDLAFAGHDLKWHLEKGTFRLSTGDCSLMLNCTESAVF
ncbi:MAG: glycoside hydrolase family 3 C-terminal domain-containing protein [Bacteroidales bacterium]|nr:glycoside hydrolase family 3 C-terminal domain-containing protein [Bacteroidales bacterium]